MTLDFQFLAERSPIFRKMIAQKDLREASEAEYRKQFGHLVNHASASDSESHPS